jgi:hypothetical protein
MGVTAVTYINNQSAHPVQISNKEQNYDLRIDPNTGVGWTFNNFIPWCWSPDYWPKAHIEVKVGQKQNFFIWQCNDRDGDHVRFSTADEYRGINAAHDTNPAAPVPGISEVNGNRVLVVKPDGSFALVRAG